MFINGNILYQRKHRKPHWTKLACMWDCTFAASALMKFSIDPSETDFIHHSCSLSITPFQVF